MALLRQNNQGHITKELSILITKKLQKAAKEVEDNIKPKIREELEREHINNVYSTFAPITDSGKKTQTYNESHKHQKSRPYHHTGILLRNIKAVVDGNVIRIEVGEEHYPDEKNDGYNRTARQVYEWLKYGTPSSAKSDNYRFKNKDGELPFATYVATPKHNFEELTLIHMEQYLKDLASDIENNKKKYVSKNLK